MPTEPAPLTPPPRPVEISPYKSAKYKKRPEDHVNLCLVVSRELFRTEPKLNKNSKKNNASPVIAVPIGENPLIAVQIVENPLIAVQIGKNLLKLLISVQIG